MSNFAMRILLSVSRLYPRKSKRSTLELHDMPKPRTNLGDERSVEELLERAATQHLSGRASSSSSSSARLVTHPPTF